MWKTTFFLGMLLSFGANAETCNIKNIEGVVSLLEQSPQEKQYRDVNDSLLELKYEQEIRRSQPAFSAGMDFDKDNLKNNELTAELLIDIDDYRNYSYRKKISEAVKSLKSTEFQKNYNERLSQTAVSLFKVSQDQFLFEKIDGLLNTITSSESIYKNRPIRSRDEEIILNSLNLLRSNLILKKSRLQDQIFENKIILKKWDTLDCTLDYKQYSKLINGLDFIKKDESHLFSLKEIQLKQVLLNNSTQLEVRRYINNFKIGPSFSKEKINEMNEYRIGLVMSFDIPAFSNSNDNYINKSRELAVLEKKRTEKITSLDKEVIEDRFKKYSESLKNLPSSEKLENDMRKIKKSFDAGVVSPLVYLESYRSYIDFLEVSEDVRLKVLESYLNLRGLYVENNY